MGTVEVRYAESVASVETDEVSDGREVGRRLGKELSIVGKEVAVEGKRRERWLLRMSIQE